METPIRTDVLAEADAQSAVSWASIAAGAVVAAASSLGLLALGVGLGLSSVSPWTNSGVSASTFKNATGIYMVAVAVMASAMGGYLAARLRTRWIGVNTNEVFFRDTAHGLITWAFATVLSASVLGAAATHIVGGVAAGAGAAAGQAAQNVNPSRVFVDRLFRTDAVSPPATPAGANDARAEATRLWTSTFNAGGDLVPADRSYLARLIASQTGMSQADAEKRLNDVIVEAKAAADSARKGAAKLAFWLTASLLFGAFAATLAAVEGGQLRDGTWQDRRLFRVPGTEGGLRPCRSCCGSWGSRSPSSFCSCCWPADHKPVQRSTRLRNRPGVFLASAPKEREVEEDPMGRGILLWLLGVPLPIILLLALFWR